MICLPRLLKLVISLVIMISLSACLAVQNRPRQAQSLSNIDRKEPVNQVFVKHKSEEEIRKAYTEYLNNSMIDDKSRLDALTRLAELEYSSSNKLMNANGDIESVNPVEEKLYYQRLERTIDLLKTSIRDYPKAKENGILLYQLAKAQSQNNQPDESMQSLVMLAEKFPGVLFTLKLSFALLRTPSRNRTTVLQNMHIVKSSTLQQTLFSMKKHSSNAAGHVSNSNTIQMPTMTSSKPLPTIALKPRKNWARQKKNSLMNTFALLRFLFPI